MRALVCGGRDYDDREDVWATLDVLHAEQGLEMILHGGARGADYWAKTWGEAMALPVINVDANWAAYPNGAGPIRNRWMIKYVPVDIVIAFPGGKGTADMIQVAKDNGIQVYEPKK